MHASKTPAFKCQNLRCVMQDAASQYSGMTLACLEDPRGQHVNPRPVALQRERGIRGDVC